MAIELPDLSGKTVLITGASSGIGAAAARRLAAAGAAILPHGRSAQRTAEIARVVGSQPFVADFARLDEVRKLAEQVRRSTSHLDVIIHNAGALVPKRTMTVDGHELTFQTNHLAPFLLQRLLSDLVTGTPGSRIVVTSSGANRTGHVDLDDLDSRKGRYRAFHTYATTKLENILFVRELNRRLSGSTTTTMAVHPGAVATAFGTGTLIPGVFYRTPIKKFYLLTAEQGAEPLVAAATLTNPERADGLYFDRFTPRGTTSPEADDTELARGLWERSETMIQRWIG